MPYVVSIASEEWSPLRIHLRRYSLDDAAAIAHAVRESLPALRPWMPWANEEYSAATSRSWLEEQVPAFDAGTAFEFAIRSNDDRYLGGCGLNRIDCENRRANLGYWVRSSATGRGAATAAVCAIRDWAFDRTDLVRLEIVIACGNSASRRVAEKAGAEYECVLRSRLMLHGVAEDATMFSFTRQQAAASVNS